MRKRHHKLSNFKWILFIILWGRYQHWVNCDVVIAQCKGTLRSMFLLSKKKIFVLTLSCAKSSVNPEAEVNPWSVIRSVHKWVIFTPGRQPHVCQYLEDYERNVSKSHHRQQVVSACLDVRLHDFHSNLSMQRILCYLQLLWIMRINLLVWMREFAKSVLHTTEIDLPSFCAKDTSLRIWLNCCWLCAFGS